MKLKPDKVHTITKFNSFSFPLLVNSTRCNKCNHLAKDYTEAELISAGFCANCDHLETEKEEILSRWSSLEVTPDDVQSWGWSN